MLSNFPSLVHHEIQFMGLHILMQFTTTIMSQLLFVHPWPRHWTLHCTGAPVMLNSLDLTNKRFCTLDLAVPMKVHLDHKNVPKCHLIFRGVFKGGEEWADTEKHASGMLM
jgi:hypothetical protein